MTAEAIQVEALRLAPDARVKLIDALWDSLSDSELKAREAAHAAEAERRIEAFEKGSLTARDAEDVFRDLEKIYKK